MKVLCEREKFLRAFQTVASVAPARNSKRILRNVKLEAGEHVVMLTGSDLEVGIRMEVPGCVIESPGAALLPIDDSSAILAAGSDERVGLESDGKKVTVQGQHYEFHLPSENPDEFPDVEAFDAQQYHEVSVRFFRELVRRTVFATDNESSRYALGGVLLEMTANGITGVAADGRRLARQEGPAKSVGGHESGETMTIVPTRAMQLLERALAENEENIQLTVSANDVRFKSGRATVYSRLVEGRYPQWRDVFPRREGAVKIEMTVGPFYAAVRQAAIVTSEDRPSVRFTFADGKLVLAARGGGAVRKSHVELPIAYDGAEIPIAWDPRYVADFLKVLEPEQTFVMELRDAKSAAVFSTDDGYSYVIMPRSEKG